MTQGELQGARAQLQAAFDDLDTTRAKLEGTQVRRAGARRGPRITLASRLRGCSCRLNVGTPRHPARWLMTHEWQSFLRTYGMRMKVTHVLCQNAAGRAGPDAQRERDPQARAHQHAQVGGGGHWCSGECVLLVPGCK